MLKSTIERLRQNPWESIFFLSLLVFSFWLMFHTFFYSYSDHIINICFKVWSDFAATIPLIRSFSLSNNWPPEYPLFPGLPIQYHFLFFAFVGLLEKVGLPLDWALNIPSIFGFFLILIMIYKISELIFEDRRIGILGIVFFIFNGSLSFIQYFQKHGFNFKEILKITDYSGMAPWDGGNVLGFWHLNVFINQRHFCFALGLLMLFIWVSLNFQNFTKRNRWYWTLFFGIILGLMPFIHKPVLLMMATTMLLYFVFIQRIRIFLILVGLISVPIVIIGYFMGLNIGLGGGQGIEWYPGFSIHNNLNLFTFSELWTMNWGLHFFLILLGILFMPKQNWKYLSPAVLVFTIAFLFKFSSDILANHKFFNFSLILLQLVSAYLIIKIYDKLKRARFSYSGTLARLLLIICLVPLTLSGVLDFIAVINDPIARVKDKEADPIVDWIYKNTSKDKVILNSSFLYHPASIIGRKIFLGWPYFVTTSGYDFDGRKKIMAELYRGEDPHVLCPLLKNFNIEAITLEDNKAGSDMVQMNKDFFMTNFKPAFTSADSNYNIFRTADICQQ